MVRFPCFCVRHSLGKSCMTSFQIGWFSHSFPVYCRFHCLFKTGMPRVLKIVVIPHNSVTCKGFGNTSRPLWHMQRSFSIRRSSSPLSSTALRLKYCFRVLLAFWASTIYFTVRGYIPSSSLRFEKHWFIWIVLPSSESPCVSWYLDQNFEYINHFWLASSFADITCVAWLYSLVEFSLGSHSSHEIASATVLCIPFN